jgi:ribosomal protein L33
MAQKTMTIIQNKQTGYTYYTTRAKKGEKADEKLKLRKYDPILRAHAWFEEVKGSKPKKKTRSTSAQGKKGKVDNSNNSAKKTKDDKNDKKNLDKSSEK